ncbi:Rrf2 family transcriptional regulator [Fodinicola feengrottensis]
MSQGVEWAAHCCLLLDWLDEGRPVPTGKLAAAFEVAPAYLNKQLQALVRADILVSTAGVRGGFELARPLNKITLMDIVAAIEGPEDAFECTEIRKRGPGSSTPERILRMPCQVTTAMRKAELQWRRALAATTLADIGHNVVRHVPKIAENMQRWYASV